MQDASEPSSSTRSHKKSGTSSLTHRGNYNGQFKEMVTKAAPIGADNEQLEHLGLHSSSAGKRCTVCGITKNAALLDLSENKVMQRRLNKDWNMPLNVVQPTLKAICVECVCKLNMHSEVTRSIMHRLKRINTSKVTTSTQLSPPIADAEVSTTLMDSPAKTDNTFAESSHSSSSVKLQAYSAPASESPSATESVDARLNSVNASEGWKWHTRLICPYCTRAYFRKDYYSTHLRRCKRQRTKLRRSTCRVLNAADYDDDDGTQLAEIQQTRTYHCHNCDDEYDNRAMLRQHQRTAHVQLKYCDLCNAEFSTKYEWELHYTICSAKLEALQKSESERASALRSTRSRSLACSVTLDDNEYDDNVNEDDRVDNDDDNTSEADTMYTRRMNFTGDWVVNHSRSNSNSALSLSLLYDDYVLEESHISTDKEYDLYLLDLLKTQVQLKAFTCFAPACYYRTDSLVQLMKHDYVNHWKMSWFYCQKCGDVFTSKVFLDYHLHRQNRGVYICHKCHDEFEFQHQLDRHLLLHSKGINYHCNYCRLEFLSEAKLLAHCEHEQHSPNDEPPLICIDHTLSISNPVPELPPESSKKYNVRVLNLPFRHWPSKRPMHLPNHKPFRFSIGICEFDNRNPPNCVGCH